MSEVHKSREELIARGIIGREDYRMDSGRHTDRYEKVELYRMCIHPVRQGTILERDDIKGFRITHFSRSVTGEIEITGEYT